MSATQVSAASTLLRKVMPDLQAVALSGDPENPLHVKSETDVKFSAVAGALDGLARVKQGGTGGQS